MKKNNKLIIGVILSVLLTIAIAIFLIFNNSSRLSINERKWIDESVKTNKLISLNVINNSYALANTGDGVLYNFINDFSEKYHLKLNIVTFNYGSKAEGPSLTAKTTLESGDSLFFTDHYVLVSQNNKNIYSDEELSGKTINVLNSDREYVSNFLSNKKVNLVSQNNIDMILSSLSDNSFAILPLHIYLKEILTSNLNIVYHFSDMKMYYVIDNNDDMLTSIMKKYFASWSKNIDKYYNKDLFDVVVASSGISNVEIEKMQSETYEYALVNNSPYEIISSNRYGGISAIYLRGFADFAGVEFNFKKYSNINKFVSAINNNKVDLYFGFYDIETSFSKTNNGINASYYIIANSKNSIALSSVYALRGKEVYVEAGSNLESYLKAIGNINIKTYAGEKELKKLNRKDVLIFIDSNVFDYYKENGLGNYTVRAEGVLNSYYAFNTKTSGTLYKLLNKYVSIVDYKEAVNKGIYNHQKVVNRGKIFIAIAKYIIIALVLSFLTLLYFFKKKKKIIIQKKIKNSDKLKFIDQLTLLKNRNYLNENINKWSNNTVYPQTILVIDLNHLQEINDTKGYEEGDRQIKAAANALIKTQLDNSDIIRTDGNEFVVYLVGYSTKQITNYIHKLNKEFKKMPYDYGAEYGYSMILDDIKTIEDALNEATKDLKEKKESLNEK